MGQSQAGIDENKQKEALLFIFVFSTWHISNINWFKHRWCAWDSNPGRQDGRCRQIHWAMVAPQSELAFQVGLCKSPPSVTDILKHTPLLVITSHVLLCCFKWTNERVLMRHSFTTLFCLVSFWTIWVLGKPLTISCRFNKRPGSEEEGEANLDLEELKSKINETETKTENVE